MNIFNSLGSNYELSFALKARLTQGNAMDIQKLTDYLSSSYKGTTHLTYKGRDALFFALKATKLPAGSHIAINGFTCYAVYKSITDAGYTPVLIDIKKDRLHFTASVLQKNIRAVVIQNTLGIPCEIEDIQAFCKKNKSILIEDLAHSAGTIYDNNKEAGQIGDMVVFSFSQDKLVDAVSGGALVIRNKQFQKFRMNPLKKHSLWKRIQDRTYPMHALEIRTLYPFFIGKALHYFFKLINILPKPVESGSEIYEMRPWQAHFALEQLKLLPEQLNHRRKIARLYTEKLGISFFSGSTYLRFPLLTKNRDNLIDFLKAKGIYVSDIWYDAPIAPKRYLAQTDYEGECKTAESVSKEIINLPTHRGVSEGEAKTISSYILKWQTSQ